MLVSLQDVNTSKQPPCDAETKSSPTNIPSATAHDIAATLPFSPEDEEDEGSERLDDMQTGLGGMESRRQETQSQSQEGAVGAVVSDDSGTAASSVVAHMGANLDDGSDINIDSANDAVQQAQGGEGGEEGEEVHENDEAQNTASAQTAPPGESDALPAQDSETLQETPESSLLNEHAPQLQAMNPALMQTLEDLDLA